MEPIPQQTVKQTKSKQTNLLVGICLFGTYSFLLFVAFERSHHGMVDLCRVRDLSGQTLGPSLDPWSGTPTPVATC